MRWIKRYPRTFSTFMWVMDISWISFFLNLLMSFCFYLYSLLSLSYFFLLLLLFLRYIKFNIKLNFLLLCSVFRNLYRDIKMLYTVVAWKITVLKLWTLIKSKKIFWCFSSACIPFFSLLYRRKVRINRWKQYKLNVIFAARSGAKIY